MSSTPSNIASSEQRRTSAIDEEMRQEIREHKEELEAAADADLPASYLAEALLSVIE